MFPRLFLILALLPIPAALAFQQSAPPLSAKTLYYQADADESKPPAKAPAKPAAPEVKTTATKRPRATSSPAKPVAVSASDGEAVGHLGLRYNLLRYDRQSHKSTAVDPEHVFEEGDCVQIQLSPNRNGYLYVFDQGSSGKWQVLLPSALMSDEINVIRSRDNVSVPANYCFTIENPSGTEHLFVVLSRSQEDMYSLDKAIRSRTPASDMNVASAKGSAASPVLASPALEGANRLDAEIQRMRQGLGSRDLGVEKISEPDQAGEPAESVYVVNTSNVSSSRLVTEILIRHH